MLPIEDPYQHRGHKVGTKNAVPHCVLHHIEQLEQGGGLLDVPHQDGDADQVVEGDGEVDNILPLCHHTYPAYAHVSTPNLQLFRILEEDREPIPVDQFSN